MKATVWRDFSGVGGDWSLRHRLVEKPFLRITFISEDNEAVHTFAERLGYQGPFFHRESDPYDLLSQETFGFDLVKDNAKKVMESYLAWRA